MTDDGGTWHYGLIARWWAEFNQPGEDELRYYRDAIRRFGEPALDVGCGTGRLLLPLLADGLDVDGTDVSADMLAFAARAAGEAGYAPLLFAQATHELDLPRRYQTIFMCGVFGIGGRRDRDVEGLRRARAHLEPGGVLLVEHELPYAGRDEKGWGRWLAGHREGLPREWPDQGDRRRTADGDEIEVTTRLRSLETLEQRHSLEIRARLRRDGAVVGEEVRRLAESLWFAQEVLQTLALVGFGDVSIEAAHSGEPATDDDGVIVFVARG